MSEVIRDYYKKTKLEERRINEKLTLLNSHKDIAQEFEYWLKTGKYMTNGVAVEGYTAKELAKQSKFLDGEGAFAFLIELRQSPNKAIALLREGFKYK